MEHQENYETEVIGGFNALKAALEKRASFCRRIVLAEGRRHNENLEAIYSLARQNGIKIQRAPAKMLDLEYGHNKHQGIIGIFDSREYEDFDSFVEQLAKKPEIKNILLLALDKVEDSGNLGALMRSAAVFGAVGVLVPRERAAALSPRALSAAAGAIDDLLFIRVVNLNRSLQRLKEEGFWVVGAEGEKGESVYNFKFPEKTVLLLGSEAKGISPILIKNCDFLINIPMNNLSSVNSLNVSVAGGILMSEYFKGLKTN